MNKKKNKIQNKNPLLLKGASLEEQNKYIQNILKQNGINAEIAFQPFVLQSYIDEKKSFSKGLIAYLMLLEKELDQISDDKNLKLLIFQMFTELGSLVFPNTSACYSIIPKDLKDLKWEEIIKKHQSKFELKIKENDCSLKLLTIEYSPKAFVCLVSLSISKILVNSLSKNMNSLLVDNSGRFDELSLDQRPRIKSGSWLGVLKRDIQEHLAGLNKKSLLQQENIFISKYSEGLATIITEELLSDNLLAAYSTISNKTSGKVKATGYFVWCGSNLLLYPKTFALPMVYAPNDWLLNPNGGAENGGHLLFSLTNLSYQGYLNSRSNHLHKHGLTLKQVSTINKLQKIPFSVNDTVVRFFNKYKQELTDSSVLLLADDWVTPTEEMVLKVNKKWIAVHIINTERARYAATKELLGKKYQTLKNQDALSVSALYQNKAIYWPVFQDFRSRIYRIGHLNNQLDPFTRSLIRFHSDKSFVNRKKNKYTEATFNLLLKEVLVKKDLIEKWENILGNRFIYNDKFEELLLDDLLAKKLSFIQVGQMLSIRQGLYDTVGVFYDASASAYQIMGVINGDKTLCQLTNVLKSKKGEKNDLYQHVLENVFSDISFSDLNIKDAKFATMYVQYFKENVDRSLVKSIVMPLIYGKTSQGFAEDLTLFFEKGGFLPSNSVLLKLANHIIKHLKSCALFSRVSVFMKMLRAIGGFLFDLDAFIIKGYYSDTHIAYYKEESEVLFLYYKDKSSSTSKYKRQKISLTRPAQDEQGNFLKSKTKSIIALVANYVHFLDALICHNVIDGLNANVPIGTIHDSFFVKPKNLVELKERYKKGLRLAQKTHVYNLFNWLLVICTGLYKKNSDFGEIVEKLEKLAEQNSKFENDISHEVQYIPSDEMLALLKPILKPLSRADKAKWTLIIEYFENGALEDGFDVAELLNSNPGELLFPDNE
jgi:hypothetical protein